MKLLVLAFCLAFVYSSSFGQSNDSLIKIRHGFFGTNYHRGEEKLSTSEIMEVLKPNAEAYRYMQSARLSNTLYYVLSIPGALMFSRNFAYSYYFNEQWGLTAAGAALLITSYVLYFKSRNQAQKAIETYNEGLRKTSYRSKEIRLSLKGAGIALTCVF